MKTNVLIIGAGISGLTIAYNLVKKGVKDILIIDRSYIGSGSTGRCASGIRASFTSKEHVILMKRSIELWEKYNEEFKEKLFKQDGYIWLLRKESSIEFFKKLVEFHNSFKIPSRMIDIDIIKSLINGINTKKLLGALYDPIAGKADPFDMLYILAKFCNRNNVKISTFTLAKKIIVRNNEVKGVETNKGIIEAKKVVIAGGEGTQELLRTINIELPLKNLPRHALITEAFKPLFNPLIIDWDTQGVPYIVQTEEGGFYMSREIEEKAGISIYSHRIDFFSKVLTPLSDFFPWIKNIRVLRYWIGYYVTSPDNHPIYGPLPGIRNLYIAVGFSGHGYMLSPVTGEIISSWMVNGEPSISIAKRLTIERINKGKLIKEIAIVG